MKLIRRAFAAVIAALSLAISAPAFAASFSTDSSDLWWADPPGSENGWGFQIVQRYSTIFITMFVYGQTSAPTWYVSTMIPTNIQFQWSGDLYTTTGPWFGTVPYNPALFTVRKVGTVTWTLTSVVTGVLSYTVDGVAVTKNATRQTLVAENYSGRYGGAIHETDTGCADPAFNGTTENAGVLNIVQSGSAITITSLPITGGSCTYSGTLTQYGQMGDIVGNFSCTNGSSGSFHAFELQVTEVSLNGRYTAVATNPPGCHASGWFGGIRTTKF